MPRLPDNGPVELAPLEIRAQVERILASDLFKGSGRLSRFLRYIVERAGRGEGDQLKEFVIGTEVFDRDASYDPRLDSVVRVEAGRLRSKLTEYYAGPGASDPILITVPRGGYAPTIEAVPAHEIRRLPRAAAWIAGLGLIALGAFVAVRGNAPAAPPAALRGAAVAVLPLSTYSTEESLRLLATEITEGVTRELARLARSEVVSHVTAASAPPRTPLPELGRMLGATLVVGGNLRREGDLVRVEIALMDAVRDRKVRVESYTGSMGDLGALEKRIAAEISAHVPPSP